MVDQSHHKVPMVDQSYYKVPMVDQSHHKVPMVDQSHHKVPMVDQSHHKVPMVPMVYLSSTPPDPDRLWKILPVISAVVAGCRTLYRTNRERSIDEAMTAFKGRSLMKQYLPKKPIKRGFKVWVRADSHNGYISQFECYTGKKGGRHS